MIVSIDLSLRSTGVVLLDTDGSVVDCLLVTEESEEEELISTISNKIMDWIRDRSSTIRGVVIEGLSYNAFSSQKDLIAGNLWYLKTSLYTKFPWLPVGIIPVSLWRSSVLTKPEQKEAKLDKNDGLKKACVDKLPTDVAKFFKDYLDTYKFPFSLSKKKGYKDKALFDLTDAYFLGRYRQSLT